MPLVDPFHASFDGLYYCQHKRGQGQVRIFHYKDEAVVTVDRLNEEELHILRFSIKCVGPRSLQQGGNLEAEGSDG